MKLNRKNTKHTKRRKIKDLKELEDLVSLNLFTARDLLKLHLIDTKTYKEYVRKEIEKNYEGSDIDE